MRRILCSVILVSLLGLGIFLAIVASHARDEAREATRELTETKAHLRATQQQRDKRDLFIEDLRNDLRIGSNVEGILRSRIDHILGRLSEANNAPHTPTQSSPWERLQAYLDALNREDYEMVYDEFLPPYYRENCERTRFITAYKFARPKVATVAFVDEATGLGRAIVWFTTGYETLDTYQVFVREEGEWLLYVDRFAKC